jgi:hypothetical protein
MEDYTDKGPDTSGNWVTIKQATLTFADQGLPRNERSVRRYCKRGDIECTKTENQQHQPQWWISQPSLVLFIEQELSLPGQDRSEPDVSGSGQLAISNPASPDDAMDMSGENRTEPDLSDKYTAQLESENQLLRSQLDVKDGQIHELTSRAKETNVLIHGLQNLVMALQPPTSSGDDRNTSREGDNPFSENQDQDVQ